LCSKTIALQTPEIKQWNKQRHSGNINLQYRIALMFGRYQLRPLKKGSIYKELLHHLSSSSPNLTSANFQRFLDAFWVLTLQREKSKPDNNAK
jgi:hypothetical protein